MFSVVLIDDNKIAVEGICRSTDWKKFDCELIGKAYNGLDGLKLIYRTDPDIAVIDIKMPGFDGLEIIRRLHEETYDTQFIIISGYDNFKYAKDAIHYGVSDYLLKPVMVEELESALTNVIAKIQKNGRHQMVRKMRDMRGAEQQLYAIHSRLSSLSPSVTEAIRYIDRHIDQNIALSDIGKELVLSTAYFSKIFKKETGLNFVQYVTLVKMENARKLLRNPRNRVNEVARMVGYKDYRYFYDVFKRIYGHPPHDIKA
ncbi:MAG: response regulator transcription factor [Oribacterium sp.]